MSAQESADVGGVNPVYILAKDEEHGNEGTDGAGEGEAGNAVGHDCFHTHEQCVLKGLYACQIGTVTKDALQGFA